MLTHKNIWVYLKCLGYHDWKLDLEVSWYSQMELDLLTELKETAKVEVTFVASAW